MTECGIIGLMTHVISGPEFPLAPDTVPQTAVVDAMQVVAHEAVIAEQRGHFDDQAIKERAERCGVQLPQRLAEMPVAIATVTPIS